MSLRPRPVDFDQLWTPLKNSLLKIMKLECITRNDWDDHFHDVYALCVACPKDHSQQLYDEIKKTLEYHVNSLFNNKVSTHNDERLLESYKDSWIVYSKGAEYVDKLFGYLNNQFIRKQKYTEADINFGGISAEQIRSSMLEIGELALEIWRRLMIAPLEEKLVKLLLDGIKKDRDGLNVQNNVIKSVLASFVEVEKNRIKDNMELYQKLFEEKFLEKTSEHYSREAASLLESLTCSEYMQRDKPVPIPNPKKEYKPPPPPEFVRNVVGSSAGAGSGEYHIYRNLRKREYARRQFDEEQEKKEKLDQEFFEKMEQHKLEAEERTAKKRAKRQKKKQRAKNKKTKESAIENPTESSEESEPELTSTGKDEIPEKQEKTEAST